jgi:RNA polymerase sigma-70 factor (ECF subfamily)
MMLSPCVPLDATEAGDALDRARRGDTSAFEALVKAHQSMVFSLAYHYSGGDPAAAEDVAQDVFLELFRHMDRIETPAHLVFWLRRVAANRCIDRIRKRRFEQPFDLMPEPRAQASTRDVLLDDRIRELVSELPSQARAVMILRFQEDLDTSDIADVLGMPVNTVKSHIRRSVEALKQKLGVKTQS